MFRFLQRLAIGGDEKAAGAPTSGNALLTAFALVGLAAKWLRVGGAQFQTQYPSKTLEALPRPREAGTL